ncbi:MAG: hypothetical protein JO112_16495 [Planctomycetes bacterium]|nr:hypothetical protein [Planctomycetota bacterium]
MHHNRLSAPFQVARLPEPRPQPLSPQSFLWFPVDWRLGPATGWIYCLAFEQAQAVVRPSLPERDLCGTWN